MKYAGYINEFSGRFSISYYYNNIMNIKSFKITTGNLGVYVDKNTGQLSLKNQKLPPLSEISNEYIKIEDHKNFLETLVKRFFGKVSIDQAENYITNTFIIWAISRNISHYTTKEPIIPDKIWYETKKEDYHDFVDTGGIVYGINMNNNPLVILPLINQDELFGGHNEEEEDEVKIPSRWQDKDERENGIQEFLF